MMLDQQCIEGLSTAFRPNTKRNYKSRFNIYHRFCEFYGEIPFPATEWQLVRFARYLANGVTSYDTVKNYLSSVKRLHELGGYSFPSHPLNFLELELRSIRYDLAGPRRKAAPVDPTLLMKIHSRVDMNNDRHVVSYTALVVGFTLFLRKSNLVPDTAKSFNPNEQLIWSDLWWYGPVMMIYIKWSKTLQYRQKDLDLPLVEAQNWEICSVYWLQLLKKRFSPSLKDPIFSYPAAGIMVPLTYRALAQQYRTWVSEIGKDPESYTLHGLRRGGANQALTIGICDQDIMLMGDWSSNAYMEYIDLTIERRLVNMVQFVDEMDKQAEKCKTSNDRELYVI